uniref:Uncharacterized protein n=1 Tax=Cannabis sativa TaxID=3483 RepID=A0A803PBY2_CANSA
MSSSTSDPQALAMTPATQAPQAPLLLSWLRSSISKTILASVANYTTSFSVLRALEQKFASQTKARQLEHKRQFSLVHKGNLPIFKFIDKVQAIAASPIDDQDLVLQVLNGLGPEFDFVVSGITSRSDALTIEKVHALLLSHESRNEHDLAMNDLTVKMQANVALGNGRSRGV